MVGQKKKLYQQKVIKMNRIICPKGQWITITSGVTNQSFNLINEYPDPIQSCVYKINYGLTLPDIDTLEFILVELNKGEYAHAISLNNTTPINLYVMSVHSDGAIVI